MAKRTIRLAHERDILWIIKLWLDIHGGDPSPESLVAKSVREFATIKAIAVLASTLNDASAGRKIQEILAPLASRSIEAGLK